jgi:hypothetical protein
MVTLSRNNGTETGHKVLGKSLEAPPLSPAGEEGGGQ